MKNKKSKCKVRKYKVGKVPHVACIGGTYEEIRATVARHGVDLDAVIKEISELK